MLPTGMTSNSRHRRRIGMLSSPASQDTLQQRRPPPPQHRHSGPSAPWPWINLIDDVGADPDPQSNPNPNPNPGPESELPPIPEACDHASCDGACWKSYPQSRFPNWTHAQIARSRLAEVILHYDRNVDSQVFVLDVSVRGVFHTSRGGPEGEGALQVREDAKEEFWGHLVRNHRPAGTRVRAYFVENMSGPVLQMLGAKYNIEPFFFSSSISWIPSRFEEEVRPGFGDHITVILTFLKPVDKAVLYEGSGGYAQSNVSELGTDTNFDVSSQVIDTQAPLSLPSKNSFADSDCSLVLDLLAVHLIRTVEGNTLISYHNPMDDATSARYLHERVLFAGQSVYWQNILQRSSDPTFLLLIFIWHAIYAWDEALENLYGYICTLETRVMAPSNIDLTRELHLIRAHLLHYESLLGDMKKSIGFVMHTKNPAMEGKEDRELSRTLLERECRNLLSDVDRLEKSRQMQDKRLKNVMNLVFSSVNIEDSRRMQKLTEAAVRDSAANTIFNVLTRSQMKQIAYLTMFFLPASFVAAVFGMNVKEISPDTKGTLSYYFETAAPLTLVTIWIIMAFQSKHLFGRRASETTFWTRLGWPWMILKRMMLKRKERKKEPELSIHQKPSARSSFSS